MQRIKLFEEYQEDPRFKDPLGYIKGVLDEYQIILTDEKPIRIYNICYQIQDGNISDNRKLNWRQPLFSYMNSPVQHKAVERKKLDRDIQGLNYRIHAHVCLNLGKTRSVQKNNWEKTMTKGVLERIPEYQEFYDRVSGEVEKYFIVKDKNINNICQLQDQDKNWLDNRSMYFYPIGTKNSTDI